MKNKWDRFFDHLESMLEAFEWLGSKLFEHGIIGILFWTAVIAWLIYH